MRDYVRALEARIADLPSEIEAGLEPKLITKTLGESPRQHLLQTEMSDAVKSLQATGPGMIGAQKDLSNALRALSDQGSGVVARVEYANNRPEYSLNRRTTMIHALLHEWKSVPLRIWIPLVDAASILIGLFGGIEFRGRRDTATPAATRPMPTNVPAAPNPDAPDSAVPEGN